MNKYHFLLIITFISYCFAYYSPSSYPTSFLCAAGEGVIDGSCEPCPKGYWNNGDSSACTPCTNAPSHSYYIKTGYTKADCPYECTAGREKPACYTIIEVILFVYFNNVERPVLGVVFGLGILARLYMKRCEAKNVWNNESYNKTTEDTMNILFQLE